MQAAWYTRNGSARDVLQIGELPTPIPHAGEVRVKIHTSGVNPSDVKSRLARPLTDALIVPHSDGAGVIDAVGPGVSEGRIGQRVWLWNGQWQRPLGTACEFICLPEQQAVPLPPGVSDDAAACFGIPALTAIQAVRLAGDVAQKTVLVTGASSAVGHYVTQLLTLAGARVIGTVGSPAKAAHAQAAGCREVIFYKTEPVAERIKALTEGLGVDVMVDMDFSSTQALLAAGALKPHGSVVCFGSNNPGDISLSFRPLLWGSVSLRFFLVYDLSPQDRSACIDQLQTWLAKGALVHAIAAKFSLADMALAHEAVEQGQSIGNVVIQVA